MVDIAHSASYALRGRFSDAGLTLAGVIPWFGDALKGLKYSRYVDDVLEASARYAPDLLHHSDVVARYSDAALSQIDVVARGSDEAWTSVHTLFSPNSGLIRGVNNSRVTFNGMEVRAVRDLSHVDESTLRAMSQKGFAAKDINGEPLALHHLRQTPPGPVVEMPAFRHNIQNRVQHPYGNAPGVGLNKEQRRAFDAWREEYWRARAMDEVYRRGLTI